MTSITGWRLSGDDYQVAWPKRGCWAAIISGCVVRGLATLRFGSDFEVITVNPVELKPVEEEYEGEEEEEEAEDGDLS